MYSIIFSRYYQFQIVCFVYGNNETAWGIANEMFRKEEFMEMGVEDYDVISFNNIDDMNQWIREQVKESIDWAKKHFV